METKLLGFALVLFISSLPYGSAIICFDCNSAVNESCYDVSDIKGNSTGDHPFIVECEGDSAFCRKQLQNLDGDKRIVRYCGESHWDEKTEEGKCRQTNRDGLWITSCQCKDDLCNSAPSLLLSSSVFVLASAFALFM